MIHPLKKPESKDQESSVDLSLVRLGESDLTDLLTLESLCYAQPWTKANFMGELQRPITLALGVKRDSELVAYCIFWLIGPEIHLLNLAVRPTYRHQGLARHLINTMTTIGHRAKVDSIFLEVRPSNQAALTLYQSFNFQLTGRRPNYYDDGEEAVLMTLNI